jgi:hypothetical protein
VTVTLVSSCLLLASSISIPTPLPAFVPHAMQLCDCESSTILVAASFAGVDQDFYGLLSEQMARGCGYVYYYNDTCPNAQVPPAQGNPLQPPGAGGTQQGSGGAAAADGAIVDGKPEGEGGGGGTAAVSVAAMLADFQCELVPGAGGTLQPANPAAGGNVSRAGGP